MLTSIIDILHLLTDVTKQFFSGTLYYITGGILVAQQSSRFLVLNSAKMDIPGRIVVYSIVGCPHCMKAKNSLQEKGLPYTDISLDKFPQCRAGLAERTGKHTVPQIFFNEYYVGGNSDLEKVVSLKTITDCFVCTCNLVLVLLVFWYIP